MSTYDLMEEGLLITEGKHTILDKIKVRAWQHLEVKSFESLSRGEILYDFKGESQRASPQHAATHTCAASPLVIDCWSI